jgi:hypothetical protein
MRSIPYVACLLLQAHVEDESVDIPLYLAQHDGRIELAHAATGQHHTIR